MSAQSDIRTPQLNDVVDLAIGAALRDLHVAKVGVVESYDSSTQTCSVSPVIQVPVVADDGTTSFLPPAVISGVPVCFLGGGGFRVTFPLRQGDFVTLLFTDNSLDIWKSLSGNSVAPVALGFHGFNDCVAIPGIHPNPLSWQLPRGDSAYFGQDGGPQIEITPSAINLGDGATAPVGRVGDQVTVTITPVDVAAMGLMSTTGPVTATSPVDVTGTITAGSPLVNSR